MAKFTATVPLNIRLPGGFEAIGVSGTTHRIPDSLVDEFVRDQVPSIPGGVTWITQDETSALAISADVTTALALKFDKAGGIISGATTATSTLVVQGSSTVEGTHTVLGATHLSTTLGVTGLATLGSISTGGASATSAKITGQAAINAGFTNTFDTDLYVAGSNRTNPANLAQSIYAQLRVQGSMSSQVMDAAAFEIRLNSISNASYLNAIETSVVITGGANTIPDTRALTANMTFSGTPTGTITAAKLIVAQTIANSTSATIGTVYGLYVEPQTIGTTGNYSIYAPTGTSLFGQILVSQSTSLPADIRLETAESLRWIIRKNTTAESGSNVGSDFEIIARSDTGGNVGTALTIFRSTFGIQFGTGPLGFFGTTPVAKKTGWGAATNTKTRTTFDTTTVTTAVLAAHVGALIDDLLAYGLISA